MMMKYATTLFLLCGVFGSSCTEKTVPNSVQSPSVAEVAVNLPDVTVEKSALQYDNQTSQWTLDGQLYSGYAVSFFPEGAMAEKIGFMDGKKQHRATLWFPDGHLKRIEHYQQGKLHGEKKSWSPEAGHVLVSRLNYHLGKAHGEQTLWYPTGELYKKLHLHMGIEEGMQQAFRKNGALYANYEAVKGRIFGLKKSALCYGLEDENIRYED